MLRKLIAIVFIQMVTTAFVAAQPTTSAETGTIWNLPVNQRQAMLADEIQQAQRTQRLTTDLSAQIQAAYASRDQAQSAAQQASTIEAAAQLRSSAAIQDASQAAFGVGYDNAARSAEAKQMPARVDMVVAAAKDWTPPKQYAAATSKVVALDDPFSPSPTAEATSDPLAPMRKALEGTCLLLDEEHGVAQVRKGCVLYGRSLPFHTGDYPILANGSLLDSPDKIHKFLESCADLSATLYTLRNGSEMVVLNRQ